MLNLTIPFRPRKYVVRPKLLFCLPTLVSLSVGVSSCGDGSSGDRRVDPRPYFAAGATHLVTSEVAPDSVSYLHDGRAYLLLTGPPKDIHSDHFVRIDVLRDSTALHALEQHLGETVPYGAVFLLLADSTKTFPAEARASFSEGPELLAILVTSSTCSAATDDAFQETFDRAIQKLKSDAAVHGKNLATLGVAVDWDIDQGLQALSKFGRFDEIATGRNWLNSTALRLLAPTVGGTSVIPQFIVVRREVVKNNGQVEATADSVVLRLIGPDAIADWERDGAVLSWEW